MLGMFCDFVSRRTDLVFSEEYSWSHYREVPEDIQDMAQALSILFQIRAGEKNLPFVTTGFWGENGRGYSRDNHEEWFDHGGHILEPQMMPFEEAMAYYGSEMFYGCPQDGDCGAHLPGAD